LAPTVRALRPSKKKLIVQKDCCVMTLLPIAVPFSPKSERILDMSGSFFLQGLTGVPLLFIFFRGEKEIVQVRESFKYSKMSLYLARILIPFTYVCQFEMVRNITFLSKKILVNNQNIIRNCIYFLLVARI
jgi:hypothetical protein